MNRGVPVMNIIPMNPKAYRPNAQTPAPGGAGKVIAITSGKGGVGKTNVTSNLAIALAKQGHRVCIFDADTSLANINIIMGVTPRYTIEHLLSGERSVEEILAEAPQGVMIIPAASGIAELASLDDASRARLIGALQTLEESFDYLLIDTAAGIGESVLSFVRSAQYTILVISTEPTSLTDAFALLRVLKRQEHERPAYVLVNMALNYANSMEIYKRFEAAVRKYLAMKVYYLGYITDDKAIKISVGQQRPVLLNDPEALASRCFTTLAAVLAKQFTATPPQHSFSAWWSELAGDSQQSPQTNVRAAEPAAPAAPAPAIPAPPAPPQPPEPIASHIHDDPESALQALAERAAALLADDGADADRCGAVLAPLLTRYLERFQRLPIDYPGDHPDDEPGALLRRLDLDKLSESELRDWSVTLEKHFEQRFKKPLRDDSATRAALQDKQDRLLREYRDMVARLEAQETLLHQTLDRLYAYIDSELPEARRLRTQLDADKDGTAPIGPDVSRDIC